MTITTTERTELKAALGRLDAMGDPDAIAEYLRDQGVKGNRQMACQCPVARWLSGQIGGRLVSVTSRLIHAVPHLNENERFETVNTPANVSDFVYAFDTGSYPALEA